MSKPTLEEILAVYNSIHPSRRRWYGNTNKLRNNWPELYKVLEQASGRSGGRPVVFDPNWHEVAQKGSGVRGAANKAIVHEVSDVVEEAKTREAVIATAKVIEAVTEAPTQPDGPFGKGEDTRTHIEVDDQDVGTKVKVNHLPVDTESDKVVADKVIAKKPAKKKKKAVAAK